MLPAAILLVEQRKRNSLSFGSAIKNDGYAGTLGAGGCYSYRSASTGLSAEAFLAG